MTFAELAIVLAVSPLIAPLIYGTWRISKEA